MIEGKISLVMSQIACGRAEKRVFCKYLQFGKHRFLATYGDFWSFWVPAVPNPLAPYHSCVAVEKGVTRAKAWCWNRAKSY